LSELRRSKWSAATPPGNQRQNSHRSRLGIAAASSAFFNPAIVPSG
jgi:hypothetical protein